MFFYLRKKRGFHSLLTKYSAHFEVNSGWSLSKKNTLLTSLYPTEHDYFGSLRNDRTEMLAGAPGSMRVLRLPGLKMLAESIKMIIDTG